MKTNTILMPKRNRKIAGLADLVCAGTFFLASAGSASLMAESMWYAMECDLKYDSNSNSYHRPQCEGISPEEYHSRKDLGEVGALFGLLGSLGFMAGSGVCYEEFKKKRIQ